MAEHGGRPMDRVVPGDDPDSASSPGITVERGGVRMSSNIELDAQPPSWSPVSLFEHERPRIPVPRLMVAEGDADGCRAVVLFHATPRRRPRRFTPKNLSSAMSSAAGRWHNKALGIPGPGPDTTIDEADIAVMRRARTGPDPILRRWTSAFSPTPRPSEVTRSGLGEFMLADLRRRPDARLWSPRSHPRSTSGVWLTERPSRAMIEQNDNYYDFARISADEIYIIAYDDDQPSEIFSDRAGYSSSTDRRRLRRGEKSGP